MSPGRGSLRSLVLAIGLAVVVAAAIAGCGSSSDETDKGATLCRQITQQRSFSEKPTQRRTGESFPVSLASIKDNPGETRLTPISLSLLDSLPGEEKDERFEVDEGVFAIVVYRVENTGPNAFKPEDTIGEMFGIQVGENRVRTYLRSDRDEACGKVGADYADNAGLASPKSPVESGDTVKTVTIYSIPEGAGEIAWTSANTGNRVPLP